MLHLLFYETSGDKMGKLDRLPRAKFRLIGAFAIERADGVNVTPRGRKSRALLAMLALTPDGVRSRKWIQSKLWSDRGEEQGAASLRQELSEIRKVFRRFDLSILSSDRQTIRLDLESISVDVLDKSSFPFERDLLEGLDIRDQEFEDWLRQERRRWLDVSEKDSSVVSRSIADVLPNSRESSRITVRPCLALTTDDDSPDNSSIESACDLILDLIARSILNFEVIDVLDYRITHQFFTDQNASAPDWILQAKASALGGSMRISLNLYAAGENRVIWSDASVLSRIDFANSWSQRIIDFIDRAVFVVLDQIVNPRLKRNDAHHHASRLALGAIFQAFRLHDKDLDAAERMLTEAYEIEPRSTYLGWLLFISVTRFGERRVGRTGPFHDQVREYSRRALETDPFNPITLALTAHTHSFIFREYEYALELLDRAVAANPMQAICRDMRALTLGYLGETDRGYADAMHARALGGPPPYRYCIDTTCCILSTLNGQFEEGMRHGKRVLAQRPNYLPALRYTASCQGHLGRIHEATQTVARLREWEPDFTLDLLRNEDYPVAGVFGASIIQSGLSHLELPNHAASGQ